MKTLKNLLKRESGFSLVELMIVVAIIGILSAVAVPNFKKYQAKSKTSEAKLQLAAMYTAQTSFFADFDTYASCLISMGYDPRTEFNGRYYMVGFTASSAQNTVATTNGAQCPTTASGGSSMTTDITFHNFQAGKASGATAAVTSFTVVTATAAANAFIVGAEGNVISNAPRKDAWIMDENKKLTNSVVGY